MRKWIDSMLERPLVYRTVQVFPGYFLVLAYQRLLRAHLPLSDPMTILDVGCGTGGYAEFFSNQKYIGVDINPSYISTAKRLYSHLPHARYLCLDLNELPAANLSANHAFCVAVTHHLTDEELLSMVENALKAVSSTFVIVDLCLPPLWRNPLGHLLVKMDRGRHGRSRERLIDVVSQSSGKIEKITSDFGFPHPAVGLTIVPKR